MSDIEKLCQDTSYGQAKVRFFCYSGTIAGMRKFELLSFTGQFLILFHETVPKSVWKMVSVNKSTNLTKNWTSSWISGHFLVFSKVIEIWHVDLISVNKHCSVFFVLVSTSFSRNNVQCMQKAKFLLLVPCGNRLLIEKQKKPFVCRDNEISKLKQAAGYLFW